MFERTVMGQRVPEEIAKEFDFVDCEPCETVYSTGLAHVHIDAGGLYHLSFYVERRLCCGGIERVINLRQVLPASSRTRSVLLIEAAVRRANCEAVARALDS
jgi:hypothetical protein